MQRTPTSKEIEAAFAWHRRTSFHAHVTTMVDYICELHDRLREARDEYRDVLNGIYFEEDVPTEERIILIRINSTLSKLPKQ